MDAVIASMAYDDTFTVLLKYIVTTAEMLRAQGRAEGEAGGYVHGRAEALLQLLTLKFGPLPQIGLDVVRAASVGQLQTWTARVLTAETLAEVLR